MHSAPSDSHPPLRRVALHVEEVRAGRYQWVLSEVADAASAPWTRIDRAAKPASTYREAVAQGLLRLQGMVDDLDAGPRQTHASTGDEIAQDASGGDPAPDDDSTPAGDEPKGARTAFGFGRVR